MRACEREQQLIGGRRALTVVLLTSLDAEAGSFDPRKLRSARRDDINPEEEFRQRPPPPQEGAVPSRTTPGERHTRAGYARGRRAAEHCLHRDWSSLQAEIAARPRNQGPRSSTTGFLSARSESRRVIGPSRADTSCAVFSLVPITAGCSRLAQPPAGRSSTRSPTPPASSSSPVGSAASHPSG